MKGRQALGLFELSIFITISSVILTTAATSYFNYYKRSKIKNNITKINNLKTAIETYFATNGYLPCPADPTLPFSSPNYGTERLDDSGTGCSGDPFYNVASGHTGDNYNYSNTNGATGHPIAFQNQSRPSLSTISHYWLWGSVPTASLGLKPSDGIDRYGNKISYVVHDGLANYKRHTDAVYKNLIGFANSNIMLIVDYINSSTNYWYRAPNVTAKPTAISAVFFSSSGCTINNFIGLTGNNLSTVVNNIGYGTDMSKFIINLCGLKINNTNNTEINANNIAFVLVSYGKTGKGAWSTNGNINSQSANAMEQSNSYSYYVNIAGSNYSGNYYFNSSIYNGSTSSTSIPADTIIPLKFYQGHTSTFDNYLVYDTTNQLINKAGMNQAIYCMPTTFPIPAGTSYVFGIDSVAVSDLNQTVSGYSSSNYSQYNLYNQTYIPKMQGQTLTFNGVTKTCSDMGTWV